MKNFLKNNHKHVYLSSLGLFMMGNLLSFRDLQVGGIIGSLGVIGLFVALYGQRIDHGSQK